ncbi:DUF4810 domain-containing protein [Comamonas composti]|uniref:DUF4810 domain-containing protein n=1 Tax=Comamonas composti TaxID=408558 RepID=UPI000479160A|nr:DUF4810 domain-containing protein [Comamonas composti]
MKSVLARAAFVLAPLLLAGCASPSPALYTWGNYQTQLYKHLKDDGSSPEEQLFQLEEMQQKARASGQALPPGYRAHMGLLYAKLGNHQQAALQLSEEKRAFPESAVFMDLLLKTFTPAKSR